MIEEMATFMTPGESRSLICPECGGGRSHERSFNISMLIDGSLAYMCHRASCSFKGRSGATTSPAQFAAAPPKLHKELDQSEFRPLIDEEYQFLMLRYGLTMQGLHDIKMDGRTDRFAFRILSPTSEKLGYSLRTYDGRTPKTLTYKLKEDCQLMDWWTQDEDWDTYRQPVFLVEDQVSAIKIWQLGYSAVALCGTHLNVERVMELRDYFDKAVLLLDPDAFRKSAQYVQDFKVFFRRLEFGMLKQDPKDTPLKELEAYLGETHARIGYPFGTNSRQKDMAQNPQVRKTLSGTTELTDSGCN